MSTEEFEKFSRTVLDAGLLLSEDNARAQEAKLIDDPTNLRARIKLVGFYKTQLNTKEWLAHVLWFIKNQPAHPILWWPEANCLLQTDSSVHEKIHKAWETALTNNPECADIKRNAAASFFCADKAKSLSLIEEALLINNNASAYLIEDYILYSNIVARRGGIAFSEAMKIKERCEYLLVTNISYEKRRLLQTLALLSYQASDFVSATKYANDLLKNHEDHLAHAILGMIYVSNQDVEKATSEFVALTADPAFRSHSLEFDLATAILRSGEKRLVLSYLVKCWKPWPTKRFRILLWMVQILCGQSPKLQLVGQTDALVHKADYEELRKIGWQKLNTKKWIVVSLGVGLSMLGGLYMLLEAFLSQSLCSNTICQEVFSPDRKLKAVIFERECGATTATSTQISLLQASELLPGQIGNVFIINSSYGSPASPVTRVKWSNNRTLEVVYSLYSHVTKSESHPIVAAGLFRNEKVDVDFHVSKSQD